MGQDRVPTYGGAQVFGAFSTRGCDDGVDQFLGDGVVYDGPIFKTLARYRRHVREWRCLEVEKVIR